MNAAEKKTFSLLMLRPDKQFYEGEVRSLTAAEPDGQISLLPGHMPMFINITTGMASLTEADGTKRTFATGEGMLAVYRDKVVLQSDFLAWEAGGGDQTPRNGDGAGKGTAEAKLPRISPEQNRNGKNLYQFRKALRLKKGRRFPSVLFSFSARALSPRLFSYFFSFIRHNLSSFSLLFCSEYSIIKKVEANFFPSAFFQNKFIRKFSS